jgi:hypothetical protein
MLKSLAEGSGRFQEIDCSPLFGIDPQARQHRKSSIPSLWILGIRNANPRTPAKPAKVKLLARLRQDNKPRHPHAYYLHLTLY